MSIEVPQEQSGEEVVAAAPVADQINDGQPEQAEKLVPLAALESERSQRQQLQDEVRMIKDHLSLMQARPQQPAPVQEPTMQDDDVMTYGEFRKVAGQFESQIKGTLNELQMSKKHSDYDDVVRKYLPEVIREDPQIAETLRQTQDFNLAYRLAKTSDGYRKDRKQQKRSTDAERILSNSEQSGNLSSVGGTTPISMAKRYKDMSDDNFRKEMAKNVGYTY